MRICSRCRRSEEETPFTNTGSYCKACRKNYVQENRAHVKEVRRRYHEKNKKQENARNKMYYHDVYKGRVWGENSFRKLDPDFPGGLNKLVIELRHRSKTASTNFNLDENYLLDLYNGQNCMCAVTGLKFETDKMPGFGKRPFAPSLDRINSNLGYVKGNVRFVCTIVNMALNEFGDELFGKMCEAYVFNKRKI